jgi:Protein of unknown function (DUF3124)
MAKLRRDKKTAVSLAVLGLFVAIVFPGTVRSDVKLSKGQTIYVAAYSHIYHGDHEQPFNLTITLSVRNTDMENQITLSSIDYYDTDGKFIKKYMDNEVKLAPLASTRYVVKESDKSGGSGANFMVTWKSEKKVTPPIVETIMISTSTQQGISFSSRGVVIKEH